MLTKMKQFYAIAMTLMLSIIVTTAFAQKGTVRGTIIEDATGLPLISVTVAIQGTGSGTITDFDGKFELSLDPGVYTLECSFLSFSTMTITDVEVKAGEVTVFDNIRMKEETEVIDEVVITATQVRNTEAAILTIQRKSPNLLCFTNFDLC